MAGATAPAVLVNVTSGKNPGPRNWVATNIMEAGASLKSPAVSLSVPDRMTVISSGVPRSIESTVVSVSVNVSVPGPGASGHDRMTSAPSGLPPGGTGVVSP